MTVLGPFWGPWIAIWCQERSLCFDNFPNVSCFLFLSTQYHVFSQLYNPFLTRVHVFCFFFPLLSSPLSPALPLPCPALPHTTHHTRTDTTHHTRTDTPHHLMDGFGIDENSAVLGSEFCWIAWFSSVRQEPRVPSTC